MDSAGFLVKQLLFHTARAFRVFSPLLLLSDLKWLYPSNKANTKTEQSFGYNFNTDLYVEKELS